MQICTDHWARLRKAIDDRGLTALVADDGASAARNLADEAGRGRSLDNFDPLMAAHNAIVSNCLGVMPSDAAMHVLSSPTCPLCFINENNPAGHNYDEWLERAADDALVSWQSLRP